MNEVQAFMGRVHQQLEAMRQAFQEATIKGKLSHFKEFKSGLQQHMEWEEHVLFPIFSYGTAASGSKMVNDLISEHTQINELLNLLLTKLEKNEETKDLEKDLSKCLDTHEKKEEDSLFPWFDESLGNKQRKKLIAKMTAFWDPPSP